MPDIGVLGGSGFYSLLDEVSHLEVETPYGDPSDQIAVGVIEGREVAFLPRHGRSHSLPPGAINYRANLWAMKSLGVGQLIAPCAAGSLQAHIRPGELVICDQFVDRTSGRADSYLAKGPKVGHAAAAHPYCPRLRVLVRDAAIKLDFTVHDRGTVVVIQGPRFSSLAESRWYAAQGWEVINMTQYPEMMLARELEICYANISLITDYDAGLAEDPGVEPVSVAEAKRVFAEHTQRLRDLIVNLIPRLPTERDCPCPQAMRDAYL